MALDYYEEVVKISKGTNIEDTFVQASNTIKVKQPTLFSYADPGSFFSGGPILTTF